MSQFFLKVSRALDIPTIIPYLVYFADIEMILIEMFATKKLNQIYLPHSISSILKRNYRIKVERNCYYYPHQIANALQQIWCTPFEKSVRNGFSGKNDILCIDCEYNKDLYISRGLDARKIRVIEAVFLITLQIF